MFVGAVAVMFADVIVAIKLIALVALCPDGVGANADPISTVHVMRHGGVAGVMMLEVHTNTPVSWAESIPQVVELRRRIVT